MKTPKHKISYILIGAAAALTDAAAYAGEAVWAAAKGYCPPEADSLGIPLAEAVVVGIIFLVFAAVNCLGLRGTFSTHRPPADILKRPTGWGWVFAVETVLALLFLVNGLIAALFHNAMASAWFYVVPEILWVVFFGCLTIGRAPTQTPPDLPHKAANQ